MNKPSIISLRISGYTIPQMFAEFRDGIAESNPFDIFNIKIIDFKSFTKKIIKYADGTKDKFERGHPYLIFAKINEYSPDEYEHIEGLFYDDKTCQDRVIFDVVDTNNNQLHLEYDLD
jgi:hypothetical protein